MAEYTHEPGWGSLFSNTYKEEGSKQPDYKGKGKLEDGTDIELAGWRKQDKNGNTFLNVKIQKPYPKQDENHATAGDSLKADELDF
tara:strand:+ start:1568 stop:1825 length:258 start_codon:yes stop_codon:yes gene_type:complete